MGAVERVWGQTELDPVCLLDQLRDLPRLHLASLSLRASSGVMRMTASQGCYEN